MRRIRIVELQNENWNIDPDLDDIDVGGKRAREYLLEHGIEWDMASRKALKDADLLLFKGVMDYPQYPQRVARAFLTEVAKRIYGKPYLTLMGEPREHCFFSYLFSDKEAALCVAPADDLDRIFLPQGWKDPHLEGWESRKDRICWIGRPMPDRVRAARALQEHGVELDIYSRQPWPLSCWKGYAQDDHSTSLGYRYRIVFENYSTHRYHSEKLFLSLRSGCITFYQADPELSIPEIDGLFVPYSPENILERNFDAHAIMRRMDRFMNSDGWLMYSHKAFFDTLIGKVNRRMGQLSK